MPPIPPNARRPSQPVKVKPQPTKPPTCIACEGTGRNSNNRPCYPCQGSGRQLPRHKRTNL